MQDSADLQATKMNIGSIVALYHLWRPMLTRSLSAAEARAMFNSFPEKIKTSGAGKEVSANIAAETEGSKNVVYKTLPKLDINETIYDFSLYDVNGNQIKGANVYGKYTIKRFV